MAVTQELGYCHVVYNLTEHSFTVTDTESGDLVLKVWRLPDNPGGFSLLDPERRIEINNPNGVVFIVPDAIG